MSSRVRSSLAVVGPDSASSADKMVRTVSGVPELRAPTRGLRAVCVRLNAAVPPAVKVQPPQSALVTEFGMHATADRRGVSHLPDVLRL
jgi:hypothetical protein